MAEAVKEFFANIYSRWGLYLAALSAIGVVTMALIQILKDTTPARRWFQQDALRRWLREGAADASPKIESPVDAGKAEVDLVVLATDGDASALTDLQIEQLAGQTAAASQVVLAYPRLHADLFAVLASSARKEDLQLLLTWDPPVASSAGGGEFPATQGGPPTGGTQAYIDARTRVAQQVQRAIDAFQIATAYRWQWWLKVMSFAVSCLIAYCASLPHQMGYSLSHLTS